jgi:hypothetical protein
VVREGFTGTMQHWHDLAAEYGVRIERHQASFDSANPAQLRIDCVLEPGGRPAAFRDAAEEHRPPGLELVISFDPPLAAPSRAARFGSPA